VPERKLISRKARVGGGGWRGTQCSRKNLSNDDVSDDTDVARHAVRCFADLLFATNSLTFGSVQRMRIRCLAGYDVVSFGK
jgi:hypothetical protein